MLEGVAGHLVVEEGASKAGLEDWARRQELRRQQGASSDGASRYGMTLFVVVLLAVVMRTTTAFGGDAPTKPGTPTFSPTTSQPTGYKAPSVPGEVLDVPLVDLTATPTMPTLIQKNAAADAASRYSEKQKSGDIAGAVNVNEEAREETTTAMNAVAYIFLTFVGLLALVGGVVYRQRLK